jgi:hypothetical protein
LLRGIGTYPILSNPIVPVSLLIVGSSGMISILLPYAAENYPLRIRGRATGWVAGWSKVGGLIAQGLSVLAVVPALGSAAAAGSLLLIAIFGRETRGRDLRELEHELRGPQRARATGEMPDQQANSLLTTTQRQRRLGAAQGDRKRRNAP